MSINLSAQVMTATDDSLAAVVSAGEQHQNLIDEKLSTIQESTLRNQISLGLNRSIDHSLRNRAIDWLRKCDHPKASAALVEIDRIAEITELEAGARSLRRLY